MTPTETASSSPRPTLSNLHLLPLDDHHAALWEAAKASSGGPTACRQRMQIEARDLLALSQISRRLQVLWIDLSTGLRAKVMMETPVPCRPDPTGPLQIASSALLGLHYPPEAMILPQPGYAFVRILQPRPVFHSNVSADANQLLCLGPSLCGIPLREILLMTYGALSMQTTQLNQLDPAGVLNATAADWWQRNTRHIPLSREPFIRTEVNHA